MSCRVLHLPRGGVSGRERRAREGAAAATLAAAVRAHLEPIATTWPTAGSRRVTAQLRREAEPVHGTNRKRVRRRMRDLGVVGKAPTRRRARTTDSDHPPPRFPNLVRDLVSSPPDHVGVGAITAVALLWRGVWSSPPWQCSWTSARA